MQEHMGQQGLLAHSYSFDCCRFASAIGAQKAKAFATAYSKVAALPRQLQHG